MAVTVLCAEKPVAAADAVEDDGRLWLGADDLAAATDWRLKPEGLCQEEACIPLPADGSWQDPAGRIDATALAAHLGKPVVHDAQRSVWAVGQSASARGDALLADRAPDFTLPDLEGREHSLSDYLGSKVFLFTYGSY